MYRLIQGKMLIPKSNEIRKPTKTISGIAPVAVMLTPRKCNHGNCVYCPSLNVPQSYTPKSPAVMRAMMFNYDAYKQVKARIESYIAMNHPTDKIELIIMGGTFLEYPEKFQYKFIKDCYDSLNKKISKNLEQAQKLNETAKHRCTALCIETRPDVCTEKDIKKMREWGATRVELGVQIIDDKIYKKINRGHSVKDVIDATKRLKDAGFKVGYHIMPGLPGSNPKKDLQLFKKLFSDSSFKPEQLKIYPCQVIPGSELEKWYWQKKYKPYSKEQIEKLLIEMLKIVPEYCRVMRIMREIPPEYIIAGTTKIDLRRDLEKELRKKKTKIKEIRYREIGFNLHSLRSQINGSEPEQVQGSSLKKLLGNKNSINSLEKYRAQRDKLKLKITKYKASKGDEYFLEIVNKQNILFGLLRLRIFEDDKLHSLNARDIDKKLLIENSVISTNSINNKLENNYDNKKTTREPTQIKGDTEIREHRSAIIRELHIYGQALKLGEKNRLVAQHRGFGKWLINEAERISNENKCKKILIISGVGVRDYYRKLGYKLEDTYMVKRL